MGSLPGRVSSAPVYIFWYQHFPSFQHLKLLPAFIPRLLSRSLSFLKDESSGSGAPQPHLDCGWPPGPQMLGITGALSEGEGALRGRAEGGPYSQMSLC